MESLWKEPKISSIVETLQQVSIRPGMYIGEVNLNAMYSFLGTYRSGIYEAMTSLGRHKHEELMQQIIYDRGLPEIRSFHTILLERGTPESEVIKTMIEVEIQTWIRFENDLEKIA